jgi:hypothetical protein
MMLLEPVYRRCARCDADRAAGRAHGCRPITGSARHLTVRARLAGTGTSPDTELNVEHRLANVRLNAWTPLLQLLNGDTPQFMSVIDSAGEFTTAYVRRADAPEDFDEMVRQLANLVSGPQ